MRYLTTAGNGAGGLEISSGSVMDKILQSNPILEAFGNAATLRNDNSSRFGKFIQLHFNMRGVVVGGSIQTYLLEKVRLPVQQRGQRNFHVFYQMSEGASAEDKARWSLGSARDFCYTNQGENFTLRHVDDALEYNRLRTALNVLKFPPDQQSDLFSIMAGILHLGEVRFKPDRDGEGSEHDADFGSSQTGLAMASSLLGVSASALLKCVTVRNILAMNETYEKRLNAQQASDARDALAKYVYSKVFNWIVETINLSIDTSDSKLPKAIIGVLDIFGFECFEFNSFEQLCINYTNEMLQQQFNRFVFKMEQDEYRREKINPLLIEFLDNQDCLDLIEHKISGIIAVLDDECRLPKGSDKNFAARLYKTQASHPRFSASTKQMRNGEFSVSHFAGSVSYNTALFVDKNKDELPRECSALLHSSTVGLVQRVSGGAIAAKRASGRSDTGTLARQGSGGTGKSEAHLIRQGSGGASAAAPAGLRSTVGAQFRDQLHALVESIENTSPHYIRCLKPNDENVPNNFNRTRCVEQLRYGGVLEAVRVARAGFPVRLVHSEFYCRYRPLVNPFFAKAKTMPRLLDESEESPKEMCDLLLRAIVDESLPDGVSVLAAGAAGEMPKLHFEPRAAHQAVRVQSYLTWQGSKRLALTEVQLGLTKVFLRKHAYDILEGKRSRRIGKATVKLQSRVRGFLKRSYYNDMRKAALLIQRVARGMISRIATFIYRLNAASTRIQSSYRSHRAYVAYTKFVMAVVLLQSSYRSRRSRKVTARHWLVFRVVRLQKIWMVMLYRRRYLRYRRAVVFFQSAFRRRKAAKIFKELRREARDIGKLRSSNEMLKAEIKALRSRANEESRRIRAEQRAEAEEKASAAKDVEILRLCAEVASLAAALEEERSVRVLLEQQLAGVLEDRNNLEMQLQQQEMRLSQDSRGDGFHDSNDEQLQADLEMALEELSRETALRKTLEREVDRLDRLLESGMPATPAASAPPDASPPAKLHRSPGVKASGIPRLVTTPTGLRSSGQPNSTERDGHLSAHSGSGGGGGGRQEIALSPSEVRAASNNALFMQRRQVELFKTKLKQVIWRYACRIY